MLPMFYDIWHERWIQRGGSAIFPLNMAFFAHEKYCHNYNVKQQLQIGYFLENIVLHYVWQTVTTRK